MNILQKVYHGMIDRSLINKYIFHNISCYDFTITTVMDILWKVYHIVIHHNFNNEHISHNISCYDVIVITVMDILWKVYHVIIYRNSNGEYITSISHYNPPQLEWWIYYEKYIMLWFIATLMVNILRKVYHVMISPWL